MQPELITSIWGSIAKFSIDLIAEMNLANASTAGEGFVDLPDIQFLDWEAHANIEELPDADLLGPTGLGVTEISPHQLEVVFAIAASSYNDDNLFRHRKMLAQIFERLRPTKQLVYYDGETGIATGYMVITDGTMMAPMSRVEVRPWQFCQCSALLEPTFAA